MGLLGFRRGGGGVRLLIVDCPSDFGVTFSGKLITGRGEREFRGLLLDGLEYLGNFVNYCLGGDYLGVGDDAVGYVAINGKYEFVGDFSSSDLRGAEKQINVDRVRGLVMLTPYSETGVSSEINEDSAAKISIRDCSSGYYWHIGIIADGVGGFGKGDVASTFTAMNFVWRVANRVIHGGIDSNTLRDIVRSIHEDLYNEYTGRGVSLGSTLAGVVIGHKDGDAEADFYVVNVGDSPIYLVVNDSVEELSVSDKVFGHSISQAIGYLLHEVHVRGGKLYDNDYLVSVSDGVSDVVGLGAIKIMAKRYRYPWLISMNLVRYAKALGSKDDASALTVWLKG
jgi:serine/threonine protein phosphatase PrpC